MVRDYLVLASYGLSSDGMTGSVSSWLSDYFGDVAADNFSVVE